MPTTTTGETAMPATDGLPPGSKRMNVVLTTWAHRDLKVTAAQDLLTMKKVLVASILRFYEMDDVERKQWYTKAEELSNDEVVAFSK